MNRPCPPSARLAMNVVMGSALMLTPLFVRRFQRRYAVIPMLVGAAGLLTTLVTEVVWPGDRAFRPSRDLSEAVADHLE